MKHLSKTDVEKNIWVPSSLAVGMFLGFVTDADTLAFLLLLCFGATAWWSAYYILRRKRGHWRV